MEEENKIIQDSAAARFCYLCYAPLDNNKACTDLDCPLYGIPQE